MRAGRLSGRYRIGHAVGASLQPEQLVIESADRRFVTAPGRFALPASAALSPAGFGTWSIGDLTVTSPAGGGQRARLALLLALVDPGPAGGFLHGRVGPEPMAIATFPRAPVVRGPGAGNLVIAASNGPGASGTRRIPWAAPIRVPHRVSIDVAKKPSDRTTAMSAATPMPPPIATTNARQVTPPRADAARLGAVAKRGPADHGRW